MGNVMSSVVVTGCAGFIGSHLCERLLDEGYSVKGIDNFDAYYDFLYKKRNLENILAKKGKFRFYNADIRDYERLLDILEPGDVVVHLAARPGVRSSNRIPLKYVDNNIMGTVKLLEAIRARNAEQVIFGSTSSVYGNAETPFSEDFPADRPLSVYAATKRSCEIILYVYSYYYNLPVTILRLFTVYGPRVRPDMAIYKFSKNIVEGREITLYGKGKLKRDYTYVGDIVDGTLRMGVVDGAVGEAINLASGTETRIIDLANWINELTGNRAGVVFRPRRSWDKAVRRRASIEKARRILGYEPKTDMRAGLEKTYRWILENKDKIERAAKW